MAQVQSTTVTDMSGFGSMRTKDIYSRHLYRSIQATDKATAVQLDQISYGLTAANSVNTIGASAQYEITKMSSVEASADSTAGRLDLLINDGTTAFANVTVASLSSSNARFTAANMTADFSNGFNTAFTGGLAAGKVTQTFNTGASSAVVLAATGTNLAVTAAMTELSGELQLDGDRINFTQLGAGTLKKSLTNSEYIYTHGTGLAGISTGVRNLNMDGFNALGNLMAPSAAAFNINSFNSAGAKEPILAIGAGAASGAQTVQFSNSSVGIGIAPTAGFALDVVGKQRVSSDLQVLGNLLVSGTVTTVSSSSINVTDKDITLASNTSDPSLFNGGGILVGTGTSAVSLLYNNTVGSWDSSINFNMPAAKSYLVASGANHAASTGLTLNQSGLDFGSSTAVLNFGGVATLSASGFTSTNPNYASRYGGTKWELVAEVIGGNDYLSMKFSSDGGATYVTKFSVST